MLRRLAIALLCVLLLLAGIGCGNKGPLVLPDETAEKKNRQKPSEY